LQEEGRTQNAFKGINPFNGRVQPRSQGLFLFQNGGSEKPLAKAAKMAQKFVRILSRKHDKMSFVVSLEQRFHIARKQTGPPEAGNNFR